MVGFLGFAVILCGLIAAAVWLYGRQSARRMKDHEAGKNPGE